jgi:NitT/TauT family transport system substrate-binding protein
MKSRSARARALGMLVAAAACALGLARHASAASPEITFAIGAPVLIDSTAPYASVPEALNYWKAQGLKINLQPTQGATASMQLLLAGRADITNGGSSSFYEAAAKSPEIRVISLQAKNIWQLSVPAGSPIKSIPELKGKTIGAQSFSSASYLFGRAAVAASGLNPDTDVHWLPVGVGSQAAQAFRSGTIAAYATYDGPNGVIGTVLGTKLLNLPTPLDQVPGLGGYATTEKFLREHGDLVVKFLKGIYEGAVFSATNPGAALQIQWKEYPEQKPRDMSTEQAIKATLPNVESRYASGAEPGPNGLLGDLPMTDVQKSIDFMAKYGVLKHPLEASKVADMSANEEANKFDKAAIETQAKNWKP